MRSIAIIISMGLLNILLFVLAANLDLFFILLGAQLILTALLMKSEKISRREYYLALLFGIVARLLFITKSPMLSFDVNVYSQFAELMMKGQVPYRDFYFPYPLAVALLFAAIYFVFSSPFAFKIAFSLIDILNALIIPRVISDNSERSYGLIASAAYLLVPVTIIEAAWNGHFEAVVVLFMLVSLYFFLRGHNWKALIFAGVGALIKYIPIGISIGILRATKGATRRLLVILFAGATFLITYLSMTLIGSRITVFLQGASTGSALFHDYSFSAFFRIVTGFTGAVGSFALLLIGGILFLGILAEKRLHAEIVSTIVKYSLFIILAIVGLGMVLYPISPLYSQGYWRRLPEICFAQGISLLIVCFVIVAKWESLSFTKDIHLILFVLLLLMFYQPVFYPWYVLFLFPVALLFPEDEFRVFLVVCLLLYPTISVGVFSPSNSENMWFFGEDISTASLMTANVEYTNSSSHETNLTVSSGVLTIRTNASMGQAYGIRIQWNYSQISILPNKVVHLRMQSSDDPSFSKPFRLNVLVGMINSTGGQYDEQNLVSSISFISNMSMISYRYRVNTTEIFTPDYIALQLQVLENVTGVHALKIDAFLIENDLNVPTSTWLVSVPLSIIGMVMIVIVFFPRTHDILYQELRNRRIATTNNAELETTE